MSKKAILSVVAGISGLVLAATCLPAFAFGHHGGHHHGGDMKLALYAKAAGITHDQIRTAFQNSNIKADFMKLRADKNALDACIITGCTNNEISTYASDLQTLTNDKLTVWQTLFASAPNKSAATSLKTQLDALNTQKHQLLHSVFSSAQGTDTATPPVTQQ